MKISKYLQMIDKKESKTLRKLARKIEKVPDGITIPKEYL